MKKLLIIPFLLISLYGCSQTLNTEKLIGNPKSILIVGANNHVDFIPSAPTTGTWQLISTNGVYSWSIPSIGATGATGAIGSQGIQGIQGLPGKNGTAANLASIPHQNGYVLAFNSDTITAKPANYSITSDTSTKRTTPWTLSNIMAVKGGNYSIVGALSPNSFTSGSLSIVCSFVNTSGVTVNQTIGTVTKTGYVTFSSFLLLVKPGTNIIVSTTFGTGTVVNYDVADDIHEQ